MSTRTVEVRAASGAYQVLIGVGLLAELGPRCAAVLDPAPGRVLLVTDAGLPASTAESAEAALAGVGWEVSRVEAVASEHEKSLAAFERLHAEAVAARIDRGDAVVSLGGGIVGDLTGFVAATHRRGVRVIQCPTTLLAMVDASVGGKTGVNLPAGGMLHKNFIGSFHQPRLVVASVDTLSSLEERHFRAGLAECFKHGMIAGATDPDLGSWTARHLDQIVSREADTLIELIARNVAVKAEIVAGDEHETAATGGRALLNLGHTFAHAIETLETLSPDDDPAHAPLLHGEAVGLGLVAAAATAAALGRVPSAFVEETAELLERVGLPTAVRGLPPAADIVARMAHDKKAVGGVQRLVLPASRNTAETVRTPPPEAVLAGIERIRRGS